MDNEIKDKDLAVGDGAGDLITVAPVQLGGLEDPDSNVPLWTYMGRNRRSLGWCLYLLMCASSGPPPEKLDANMTIRLMVGYGFDGLLTGSLVGISAFKLHFGYYDEASGVWIISALWQSLWTACTSITMMLGAIFVGQIHGRIGLRASLVVACVFAIAGIITEQVCKNAAQFLGAKCLAGFGCGIQTALGIMTIPEYAPTRLRGPLGACLNTFILL
jgi:MFS family permease